MAIHNHQEQYLAARQNIVRSSFSGRNKALIFAFVDDLVLEGIGKCRLTKYLYELHMITQGLGKDLDAVTVEDLKRFVGGIQQQEQYSTWTKRDYKLLLRKFYRWMEKTHGISIKLDWISLKISRAEKRLPSDGNLLNESDVLALLKTAECSRDKAILSMLWESGARISELGNLCIKHLRFDEYGIVITVQGKTGSRKIRLINSAHYLSSWLSIHPLRENPEAPLWLKQNTQKQLPYGAFRMLLQRLFKKAGIHKKCNPHLFRHSRATFMANHLTEFQMNQYFGWVQGSGMPATYVHMSGRDIDDTLLTMHGMQKREEKKSSLLNPLHCLKCSVINGQEDKYCRQCGFMLSQQLPEKNRVRDQPIVKTNNVMDILLHDTEVQQLLAKKLAMMSW